MLVATTAILQANIRPQAADIAARTGDRRSAMDDWSGAVKARERAIDLWPVEPAHCLSLSWGYLQQAQVGIGDPLPWLQRAEAQLLAAGVLRPGDSRIWAALGELYGLWGNRWDTGRLTFAYDAYQQATTLAPNHATLYTGWGLVYLESQDLAGAGARFRKAVDLDATDAYAFAYLGHVELAQGNVESALSAYRQAVHWEPGLISAHLGLAQTYWSLGQQEAAELALAHTLRLDPNNAAAWALARKIEAGP
jgi:tetratricopeptide (TPR) repeat protein